MPNWAEPGSGAWLEALDYPLADREEVKANRRRQLEIERRVQKEQEEESRRPHGDVHIRPGHPYYGLADPYIHPVSYTGLASTPKKPKKELTPDEIRLAKEGAEFREMMQAKRAAKLAARAAEEKAESRLAGQDAVKEAPPTGFVYFVRNGDLFKIGITENMLRRMNQLTPDELLNVVRCSNFQEVERELHRRFKDVRLPQTEYFRLSDQQVQEVHQLMVKLAEFPT